MLSDVYLSLSNVFGMCSLALAGATFASALGALGAWGAIHSIENEAENAVRQDIGNLANEYYMQHIDQTVLMIIANDQLSQ